MKYAVVTGAYGGMGYETVKKIKTQGYTVFALDKVIKEKEDNVIPIQTDLTDSDSIQNAFNEIKTYTNEVNVIIHFAGVYMLDSLVEMNDADFKRIFDVNFFSAFRVNKTLFPLLKSGSKIIMITSELAPLNPLPFTGVYAITKSTLDKYAFSLRMELQLLKINVSVIRAGAVSTNMLGISTDALESFCVRTKNYKYNSKRFKKIVNNVEAKCVSPKEIEKKTLLILKKKKPKFAYSVNRNKLLLLLDFLPTQLQFWVIKKVLKTKQL